MRNNQYIYFGTFLYMYIKNKYCNVFSCKFCAARFYSCMLVMHLRIAYECEFDLIKMRYTLKFCRVERNIFFYLIISLSIDRESITALFDRVQIVMKDTEYMPTIIDVD